MDPHVHSDVYISHDEQRASLVSSPSQTITPTKSDSRGLLSDLSGWPSSSEMQTQAPESENGDKHGNLKSETPSGIAHELGGFQRSSHLPTPQSPGDMASYLLTRTPASTQSLQPDLESTALPTEFRTHASPSPPFRPHLIPTPESSPLVARSRNNAPHALSQITRTDSHDHGSSVKRDDPRSRASTLPRTPSRQTQTRTVTPVAQFHPTTPLHRRPTENPSPEPAHVDNSRSDDSTTGLSFQIVKDEPGGEAAHVPAQLIQNHLGSTRVAESRRPDQFKRTRRLTPNAVSLTSDLGGKDASLLWSSANVGIIDSPIKGKRIALFQETSEESFEESLMAGGYGRYRFDRLSWKVDEDADAPSQLGDAIGEDMLGSGLALTTEEKRRKERLAAFLDPPRSTSAMQLFPVEIEGCGRVLMKVEPSEPQTPPKPTSRTKRSRKRKKLSADMKQDLDLDSIAAPEYRVVDGPNWPDTEFPWRTHLLIQDGLSRAEREERLKYIESFLDRDEDEDALEEGRPSSSRRSPDGSLQSPQPGRGKIYPYLSHFKGRRRGSPTLSSMSSDPADAKTALLSKESVRAVQLRILRRWKTNRDADGDDGDTLCTCHGRDDGRPLVQCDACQTWYHLECIGIQSTSELGREEDPWFCANCVEVKTPPPVIVPLSEPTFVPTDVGGHGAEDSIDMEGYDPLFLNAGLNPSPATPWTRSAGPPTTPPRTQATTHVHGLSGTPWEEPSSSSSRGGPRTPQFDTTSVLGDMVRVYGITPGRSLETSSSITADDSPFDPTSTPSRGIRFGLPFTTPKDGRWESSAWQGIRSSTNELFHTPKRPGEDVCSRSGQPLYSHGRVEGLSLEGLSGTQGLFRTGPNNNITPVEREVLGGPRWTHGRESPLGAKRQRRRVDSGR